MHITLRADESGNSLMVRSVNFDSNHDVTQVCISMQHTCTCIYNVYTCILYMYIQAYNYINILYVYYFMSGDII